MDPTTESLLATAAAAVRFDEADMDVDEGDAVLVKTNATLDDYFATGEGVRALLIDGELWIFETPVVRHQKVAIELASQLTPARRRVDTTGWVILPEVNLVRGANAFGPDYSGWRRSRMPEEPNVTYIELAPDWICEILSRSTTRFDRVRKREAYAKAGVEHYWLVDPKHRVIEVFGLIGGNYQVLVSAEQDAKIALPPFVDIELDLSLFWTRHRSTTGSIPSPARAAPRATPRSPSKGRKKTAPSTRSGRAR